jgi:hypothetical protein
MRLFLADSPFMEPSLLRVVMNPPLRIDGYTVKAGIVYPPTE